MRRMKMLLALLLAVCVMASVCACAQAPAGGETTAPDNGASNESTGSSESTGDTVTNNNVTYRVTVVDQEGNPISGVMVQLCKDMCVPAITDEEGLAVFELPEDDYTAKVASMPEGYSYSSDITEFTFEDGSYELTISLSAQVG